MELATLELATLPHFHIQQERSSHMKPFARINLSSVLSSVALAKEEAFAKGDALCRGILVSSLAREGSGNVKGEAR